MSESGTGTGLLIRGGVVLDPDRAPEPADLRVSGDTIVEVGGGLEPRGEDVVDASGMLVMPGLINAHTHSTQSLDRGVTLGLPLDLWMVWGVYGAPRWTPEETYTMVASGALEMLRTGSTAVLDHVPVGVADFEAHSDAAMRAYIDTGIRAAVAPLVGDRDFFESLPLHLVPEMERPGPLFPAREPTEMIRLLSEFLHRWRGRHPRLIPMLGPSAPQRCSDEFLGRLAELAASTGAHVHTHLLETKSQVVATRHRYGRSVVDHLADLGLLGPSVSVAHGIWLDEREYAALRSSGSVLVHNPVSNVLHGSGLLPLGPLLRSGLPIALGTDGGASNGNQNMFEVMKFATLLQTLAGGFRHWPSPETVWRASLRGGAAALGQPIGSIDVEAKADLVLLRMDRHVVAPREHLVASLVTGEHGESVDTVIVGGEVVVRGGHSTRVEEAELLARSQAVMRRNHEVPAARRKLYESVAPFLEAMEDAVAHTELNVRRGGDVRGYGEGSQPSS